jgi:hypothetical protein
MLRWAILNVLVPWECNIQDVSGGGYKTPDTPFSVEDLYPGRGQLPARAFVAERDFYPPDHSFLYLVDITVPHAGVWPSVAILDGFPSTNKIKRAMNRVSLRSLVRPSSILATLTSPGRDRALVALPAYGGVEATKSLNEMFGARLVGQLSDDAENLTGVAPRTSREWCDRHVDELR